MRIDIWSDVVCPWCFLGKRRFDAALAQLGDSDGIEIRWRAFQLDPTASSEPGDLRRSIEAKYGDGSFDRMVHRLVTLGEEAGIGYRFDLAKRVNTVDAHRLVAWAWDTGGAVSQVALVDRLFRAYFEEGANVAEHATLAALAADVGLDPADASATLSSDRYADEVRADLADARERGLTGVPAFVINDQFAIPGAQDVDTFVNLLGRVRDRA
jgi:predicted DsbA family dithiol-disulfide isomerase